MECWNVFLCWFLLLYFVYKFDGLLGIKFNFDLWKWLGSYGRVCVIVWMGVNFIGVWIGEGFYISFCDFDVLIDVELLVIIEMLL